LEEERNKKTGKTQSKMADVISALSVITLNINGLHLYFYSINWLRIKGWENICHSKVSKSWSGYTIYKREFKTKIVMRDQEGHFIIIKLSIYQKEIRTLDICT
jgi:hypothetical protein